MYIICHLLLSRHHRAAGIESQNVDPQTVDCPRIAFAFYVQILSRQGGSFKRCARFQLFFQTGSVAWHSDPFSLLDLRLRCGSTSLYSDLQGTYGCTLAADDSRFLQEGCRLLCSRCLLLWIMTAQFRDLDMRLLDSEYLCVGNFTLLSEESALQRSPYRIRILLFCGLAPYFSLVATPFKRISWLRYATRLLRDRGHHCLPKFVSHNC